MTAPQRSRPLVAAAIATGALLAGDGTGVGGGGGLRDHEDEDEAEIKAP